MRRASAAFLSALLVAACATAPSGGAVHEARQRPSSPRLHQGPLSDYVPAAGLRWMIEARLRELGENREIRTAVRPLFPEDRLAAFAEATGVRLDRCPSALVARFDHATLYMAETTGNDEAVEARFVDRLVSDPVRASVHPRITRTSGIIGSTPETLVRVDDHLVAVSVGDPMPARVVELFALGALRRSVPALRGAALSTIPAKVHLAPIRAYASGPFTGEWARGARGLFSRALALAAAVGVEKGSLRVWLVLTGDFAGLPAASTLMEAWGDLVQSPMGRLLGLDRPSSEPVARVTETGLELKVVLALAPFAQGLHAAVSADVKEMMNFSHSDAPETPATRP